jgi:zinc transport system substrate-binding protein
MRKSLMIILVVSLIFFIGGCAGNEQKPPLTVFTSILPQKYFVEKITGDRVRVEVLVGSGKNPATYEPTPQQVMALGNAKVLFAIGVPFENAFVPKIRGTLSSLEIIDTSSGIMKRNLESHNDDGEDQDEHHEGALDPHIWLSPSLVKIQSQNIYKALIRIDPAGLLAYERGYRALLKELDEVDAELKKALAPFKGGTLFVFHPAFGYFADEFGLKQVAIETGGKEPAPSVLEDIITRARRDKVKIIFVQPEFSQDAARHIAEAIGGAVVVLNPLNPDYINNMKTISAEVGKALQ